MCGIVGAVANRNVVSTLIEGLSRLEYRGYDSAGVAVLGNGGIERVRAVGRVANMTEKAEAVKLSGQVGIGHTRWATHGGVTESNAHPHVSKGEVAVVHNGIIENHDEQRTRLKALGYEFTSQTDTEVIAHLIHYYHALGATLLAATKKSVAELTGAFAISVISTKEPEHMVTARLGCPLLLGLGEMCIRDSINTMKQEPVMEQLLPLTSERLGTHAEQEKTEKLTTSGVIKSALQIGAAKGHWDYIYEPEAKPVIDQLMVRYIESLVYNAVSENMASEQSSRMVAMKSASDNAKEVIGDLKLVYNKARQAAITKEISEIVGGAAAVA